ncbi:MAG TPA: LysR family transcriptional regulator substrate-binding protein, partial [Blastocatellia bacterium]
ALTQVTLTDPVDAIRMNFPAVTLKLQTGWSLDLLERVRSGTLDAAVVLLPAEEQMPEGLMGEEAGKERLVIVAPRHGRPARVRQISDLAGVPWILSPEGCSTRARLRRSLLKAGVDLHVAVETYNYELQLSLVAKNRGLGFVPERILKRSRSRNRLRTLRVAGLEFPLTIWTAQRQPVTGFQPVVAELNSMLSQRL